MAQSLQIGHQHCLLRPFQLGHWYALLPIPDDKLEVPDVVGHSRGT